MKIHFKKTIAILFFFLFVGAITSSCRRDKGASNPYLHMKKKPVEKMKEADNKIIKRGNKAYKKQLQSNRKYLFGRKRAPKG